MERSKHLIEVISCVRFGLLTLPQLVWLKNSCDVEINEIIDTPEVKDMIEDAIRLFTIYHRKFYKLWPIPCSYIITKGSSNNLDDLYKKLKELKLFEPVDRLWLVEQYREGQGDGQANYNSYQAFLEYLRMIRETNPGGWRTEVVRTDDGSYWVESKFLFCRKNFCVKLINIHSIEEIFINGVKKIKTFLDDVKSRRKTHTTSYTA